MQRISVRLAMSMFLLFMMSMTSLPKFANAQDVVLDFSSGQPSGQYAFASWTPKSLPDLIKGNASGRNREYHWPPLFTSWHREGTCRRFNARVWWDLPCHA